MIDVIEGDQIGSDPSLHPLADVGTTAVTVKAPIKRAQAAEPPGDTDTPLEAAATADGTQDGRQSDPERDRLEAAGFKLVRGAFRRLGRL